MISAVCDRGKSVTDVKIVCAVPEAKVIEVEAGMGGVAGSDPGIR